MSEDPARYRRLAEVNYFDELIRIRDEQRAKRKIALIKGKLLPWETNRHGIMRWYLHPCIEDTAHQSEIIYVQRIPVKSRSGLQRQQGGGVIFFLAGRGHTVLDGVRFSWEKGDCLQLPIRDGGILFQHFNDDAEEEALLIYVEANLTHALGVDKGSGFEELDAAPEYRA